MTRNGLLLWAFLHALSCGAEIEEGPFDELSGEATTCATLAVAGVSASGNDGKLPLNVLDGNPATRWSCNGVGCYLTADLGSVKTVCSASIAWYRGNERSSTFEIFTSTDGARFTRLFSGASSGATTALEPVDLPDGSARFVRVVVNGNSSNDWASITELRISGGSGRTTRIPPRR